MRLVGVVLLSASLALTGCSSTVTDEGLAEAKESYVDACSEGVATDRCECMWDAMLEAEGVDKMVELFVEAGSQDSLPDELQTITENAVEECA